jgi:hypothetical protein
MTVSSPPHDRIAMALWRRGSARSAQELALAAISRGDARASACHSVLDRLRSGAGPDDAPVPELDLALVAGLVDVGHLVEARAVLSGAMLSEPAARRLARLLDEVLAPFSADADPSCAAIVHLVRAGCASSALRALDEVLRASPGAPADLLARQRALSSCLRGAWRDEAPVVEAVTRDTVLARIRARDLPAALRAAREAGAASLAEVLARLLEATDRVLTDSVPDTDDRETIPMQGHRLAEFHVRIGLLIDAERSYRSMLGQDPSDERARTMLTDVVALRQALGEETEPVPPRPEAQVGWLKKNAPRSTGAERWAAGSAVKHASWADASEDSTARMQPTEEAELLLKLGRVEQALYVYRILAIRHPNKQVYQKRIAEIEALIAQRVSPVASEVTVRRNIAGLANAPATFDDETPTRVDRLPTSDD